MSCAKCVPRLQCAACLGMKGAVELANTIIGGLPLLKGSWVDLREEGCADVTLHCSACNWQVLNDGTPERKGTYPTTPEELRSTLLELVDAIRLKRGCTHLEGFAAQVLVYVGGAMPNLVCYVCGRACPVDDRVLSEHGVYHRACEGSEL